MCHPTPGIIRWRKMALGSYIRQAALVNLTRTSGGRWTKPFERRAVRRGKDRSSDDQYKCNWRTVERRNGKEIGKGGRRKGTESNDVTTLRDIHTTARIRSLKPESLHALPVKYYTHLLQIHTDRRQLVDIYKYIH